MQEVQMFECDYCHSKHTRKVDAIRCEYEDKRKEYANALLDDGYTLESIAFWCGFRWTLRDEIKKATKDNCFIISWWQCCNKPAYHILEILKDGNLYLGGTGSWDGAYCSEMSVDKLPKPHPKEDLFVDPRY